MVMKTFLGAGYSTWRADTANSVFGQFKGHNSGVGIWQVIELGQDIMPTNIFTKFDKDRMKTRCLRERKPYVWTIQGPYFRSAWRGWQVIELGRYIMPTNIFTKFYKDRMKTL